MSWIIGYVGKSLSRDLRERLAAFGAAPRMETAGRTYYAACGGIEETCMHGSLPDEQGHWAVLGTGIQLDDQAHLLSAADWRERLTSNRPQLSRLGGGFVALRWSSRRLEAYSDVFGLRTLYWMKADDGFTFSTKPDWLARLAGGLSVDWETFGSHWLAYHQFSHKSLAAGLERLPPAGAVRLTDAGAHISEDPYIPSPADHAVDELLRPLMYPDGGGTMSLGLSGGLDSRVLLATSGRPDRLVLHIFGPRLRRDVQIALRIAETENLPYSHLNAPIPEGDALLDAIRSHAVQAQAVSPASSALSLRYFSELHAQGKMVVDGGFGEMLRRQFMNRLLRRGRRAIEGRDAVSALPLVSFSRADVFHPDCVRAMTFGARRDLALRLDAVADLGGYAVEDRIDVLNARTRLANFFGYEQARMDGQAQSFMPFAHPRVVDAALALPPGVRRRSRAARNLVTRHDRRLRAYPLVKGDAAYPFFLPPAAGAVAAKLKQVFTRAREPAERDVVLQALKPFVLDRIQSIRNDASLPYDPAKLEHLTTAYYEDGTGGEQLDWWLAFELWREAIAQYWRA